MKDYIAYVTACELLYIPNMLTEEEWEKQQSKLVEVERETLIDTETLKAELITYEEEETVIDKMRKKIAMRRESNNAD